MTFSSTHATDNTNRVVTCSEVAQKLGIRHRCKPRKWFLNKKNRSRHKLRKYCLDVNQDAQFAQATLSFHPAIGRSSRKPINERIQRLVGSRRFELCDNLRTLMKKAESSQPQQEQPSLIHQNDSDSQHTQSSEEEEVSADPKATNITPDEEDGVNSTTNSSLSSSSNDIIEPDTDEASRPMKRRSPNTALIDIVNEINMDQEWRKKPSELTSYDSLRRRADYGLAYLIRICGFTDISSVAHEKNMMAEIFLLLNEIKARAMISFRLTLSEIDIPERNFEEDERAANPIVATQQADKLSNEHDFFSLKTYHVISTKKPVKYLMEKCNFGAHILY